VTDVLAALITYLQADTDVATEVGTRVFGGELPRDEIDDMPRKAVIIRLNGGPRRRGGVPVARTNIEVWSTGQTYYEAGEVDRAVYDALESLSRETSSNVYLHNALVDGAPRMVRDTITGWPALLRLGTVTADERSTA